MQLQVWTFSENISEDIPGTDAQTNQTAELNAAVRAVQQVIEQGLERVCIQTDSAYVHKGIACWINNWMANGWKTAQGVEKNTGYCGKVCMIDAKK